jgi:hypothetical protein
MRLTLRDAGIPAYKKICRGKKWVGRVGPTADGRWFGKIGTTFIYADSERAAFDLVCAKYFGFENSQELAEHNFRVKRTNRHRRDEARYLADRLMAGDFSAVDQLFGIGKHEPSEH